MSLRIALQAVGIVVVGLLLLMTLLAMGPVAWLVVGTMVAIGVLQVHRKRRQRRERRAGEGTTYCANCGSEVDLEAYDDDPAWEVAHCTDCGAPVETATGPATDDATSRRNCPECGSPNGPEATTCTYCDAEL